MRFFCKRCAVSFFCERINQSMYHVFHVHIISSIMTRVYLAHSLKVTKIDPKTRILDETLKYSKQLGVLKRF